MHTGYMSLIDTIARNLQCYHVMQITGKMRMACSNGI